MRRLFLLHVMKKSCPYCGIVPMDHVCPHKTKRKAKTYSTEFRDFRSSSEWTQKSIEIRERDQYLCVACRAELDGTTDRYQYHDISVHHIVPLSEDYSKRLDNDNLISLCKVHHELAEAGLISREKLLELVPPGV